MNTYPITDENKGQELNIIPEILKTITINTKTIPCP
jgi:hypothetical protein